jgi:molybdenum cofactor cytidylyltransferase
MQSDSPILIILAGGKSSRMGFPKGLLDYHGKPWILEQISRYSNFKKAKIIIVLGYDKIKYFEQIPWLKDAVNRFHQYSGVEIKVVINKIPKNGAFSSLQIALKSIENKTSVLVLPVDVPLLSKGGLKKIIATKNNIVIPTCEHNNGHPVMLSFKFWKKLLLIDLSSTSARLDYLIQSENTSSINYLNVFEDIVYQNINTSKDWNIFINK